MKFLNKKFLLNESIYFKKQKNNLVTKHISFIYLKEYIKI